jgi:hypothetical protein
MPDITSTGTRGEIKLFQLLKKLPHEFYPEARLYSAYGKVARPDFIVVIATLGVVIIEVKDWKTIKQADTEVVEIVQSDGTTGRYENPTRAAERYAFALKANFEKRAELFETYKGHKKLKFPWQTLVVFPFIPQSIVKQLEQDGIFQTNAVIGAEHVANEKTIEQALRNLPWLFPMKEKLSNDMLGLIRGVIDPQRIIETDGRDEGNTITVLQEMLINEPVQLLEPQNQPLIAVPPETATLQVRRVEGVAGSGKSLALIRRARKIAERYAELRPRILVMTFNQDIANDLKSKIDLPDEIAHVAHFHKVCRRISGSVWGDVISAEDWLEENAAEELKQLRWTPRFMSTEFSWRMENDLLNDGEYFEANRAGRSYPLNRDRRAIVNRIFNRYRDYKQMNRVIDWEDTAAITLKTLEKSPQRIYDTILIDEAQDFTPSWIKIALLLLKTGGAIFICDDSTQSIFHTYNWASKGLDVSGPRTKRLLIPFRTTRQISLAAHSLVDADDGLNQIERPKPNFFVHDLVEGAEPELILRNSDSTEVELIAHRVEELLDTIPPEQIAILLPLKEGLSKWNQLQARGVYIRTFDRMKGMEFAAVFIPHLHRIFSAEDDVIAISEKRRRVFTAMTRARYRLTMTYQGVLPEALKPLIGHVVHEENQWQHFVD